MGVGRAKVWEEECGMRGEVCKDGKQGNLYDNIIPVLGFGHGLWKTLNSS